MAQHIACGDVVEGCRFTAEGGTDEELLAAVKAHAAEDHGVKESHAGAGGQGEGSDSDALGGRRPL